MYYRTEGVLLKTALHDRGRSDQQYYIEGVILSTVFHDRGRSDQQYYIEGVLLSTVYYDRGRSSQQSYLRQRGFFSAQYFTTEGVLLSKVVCD